MLNISLLSSLFLMLRSVGSCFCSDLEEAGWVAEVTFGDMEAVIGLKVSFGEVEGRTEGRTEGSMAGGRSEGSIGGERGTVHMQKSPT